MGSVEYPISDVKNECHLDVIAHQFCLIVHDKCVASDCNRSVLVCCVDKAI